MPRKVTALLLGACLLLDPQGIALWATPNGRSVPKSSIGLVRFPPAPPQWASALQKTGFTRIPDPLVDLLRKRITLEQWNNAPQQRQIWTAQAYEEARQKMRADSVSILAAAKTLDAAQLSAGELAALREDIKYFNEVYADYLPEKSAEIKALSAQANIAAALDLSKHIPDAATSSSLKPVAWTQTSTNGKVLPLAKAVPRQPAATAAVENFQEPPTAPRQAKKSRTRAALGKAAYPFKMAAFAILVAARFHGGPPILVSDMDETLVYKDPISKPLLKSIANTVRSGGKFAILSGNTIEGVKHLVIDPLQAELGSRPELLSQVPLGVLGGGQVLFYKNGRYEPQAPVDLRKLLVANKKTIEDVRAVLEATSARFDFKGEAEKILGKKKGIQGEIIMERSSPWKGSEVLTKLILLPIGIKADSGDKFKYNKQRGEELRWMYADHINKEFKKAGIPLKATAAGLSSIDIGMDKEYGLNKLTDYLGIEPRKIIYSGNALNLGGNDVPAARMAGLVINVGKKSKIKLGPIVFTQDEAGPEGLLAYYKIIEYYARITDFFRRWMPPSGKFFPEAPLWQVPIADNLARLLDQEDTDHDNKITVEDKGPKSFNLTDAAGQEHAVEGTYSLSILLQELSLAREQGKKNAEISPALLSENPVLRTSRLIKTRFWDALTRRVDQAGLKLILADEKTRSPDDLRYLYIPHSDAQAFDYFSKIAQAEPQLRLQVEKLPRKITPEYVRALDGRHGLLALKLNRDGQGGLTGAPFVVPGGRFNEMYGWDSYFIALGLLTDGKVELARSMVDNQVYELKHYGKIMNANRSYYLTRSQPPFLSSLLTSVYERLPKTPENRAWLKEGLTALIEEHNEVWSAGPRQVDSFHLSRYFDDGVGPALEVERGHYDFVLAPHAREKGVSTLEYLEGYLAGKFKSPTLDDFFVHDRAIRESGLDTTSRFNGRTADFLSLELNALLYKTEMDAADILEREFAGQLRMPDQSLQKASDWRELAARRKKKINELMWDSERGMFFDYDFKNKKRGDYATAATFYPLWAGLASPEQAARVLKNALPKLEKTGGLATTEDIPKENRPKGEPQRQWDENGWAPDQIVAWRGMARYGFARDAQRLVYRWLYAHTVIARDFNGTIPEKLDVAKSSHKVLAEYGNVGTEFSFFPKGGFGWTNSSYQLGLGILPSHLMDALKELRPPEEVFREP